MRMTSPFPDEPDERSLHWPASLNNAIPLVSNAQVTKVLEIRLNIENGNKLLCPQKYIVGFAQ